MHEATIVDAMMEQLSEIVRREGAQTIRSVEVVVGALSGVYPEALRAAFEAAQPGTVAEHATLSLRVEPARWRCTDCGAEGTTEEWPILCERCAGARVDVSGGRELLIAAVELFDTDSTVSASETNHV